MNTASAFFKSIDLVTTSFYNDNIPILPTNTEVDESSVSKPMAVATAGTLAVVLLLALARFISFRQHRKRAMRKKKLSGNGASCACSKVDPIEGICAGRPPVQQIEIFCGVGRYLNGQSGGTSKEHYPVQERRLPDQIKGKHSIREQRSDQASNVSVMSDLLFDNWSMFSAVDTINMIDAEIQEPSETFSWGSIERQKSFGYF